jgi:hypothetical protein
LSERDSVAIFVDLINKYSPTVVLKDHEGKTAFELCLEMLQDMDVLVKLAEVLLFLFEIQAS